MRGRHGNPNPNQTDGRRAESLEGALRLALAAAALPGAAGAAAGAFRALCVRGTPRLQAPAALAALVAAAQGVLAPQGAPRGPPPRTRWDRGQAA